MVNNQTTVNGQTAVRIVRELIGQPNDDPSNPEFMVFLVHQFEPNGGSQFACANHRRPSFCSRIFHLVLQCMLQHDADASIDCDIQLRLFELASAAADKIRAATGNSTIVLLAQPGLTHGAYCTSKPWGLESYESEDEYTEKTSESRAAAMQAAHDYWCALMVNNEPPAGHQNDTLS